MKRIFKNSGKSKYLLYQIVYILKHMRTLVLLPIFLALASCTISAKNHHFKVENSRSASYDKFNNIWCFAATENESLEICSGAYRSKSQFIGLGIPVFPQLNRNSPFAYDNKRERTIEVKNLDTSRPMLLSELSGVEVFEKYYSRKCELIKTISVNPLASVWLKIPTGKSHQFSVKLGEQESIIKVKEFSQSKWHQVTV